MYFSHLMTSCFNTTSNCWYYCFNMKWRKAYGIKLSNFLCEKLFFYILWKLLLFSLLHYTNRIFCFLIKSLPDGFYDIIIYSNKSEVTRKNQPIKFSPEFFLFKKKQKMTKTTKTALKKNRTKCDLYFPTFFFFIFLFIWTLPKPQFTTPK